MFQNENHGVQMEGGDENTGLRYLLYIPPGWRDAKGQNFPLILYLHGIGERGGDLSRLLKQGIPKLVEGQKEFPFITLSPQCPDSSFWIDHLDAIVACLNEVRNSYPVDDSRIYLTGNSMGGYGAWALAIAFPDLFAAIAPICGGGEPEHVCVLRDVPVWAFHGEEDELVKLEQGQLMVDALKDCGGDVRFSVYEGVGHDSWTKTYENPELYRWFLQHSRK